jgi:hypothetical protein
MAYTDIDDPSAFFQTALYTSTGSALSVVNTGNSDLQPDLIWIKSRSEGQLNCLFNSSHTGEFLSSNLTAASDTSAGGVTSYNTDGFSIGTLGGINNGTNTHVAWQWKTGTAFSNDASSTSVGSIDSTGSVNTTSGFSIISYTGNGSANQSVAHGLGATPKIILIKNRTTAGYWCMTNPRFVSVSDPNILYLQITAAEADDTNINGTTAPSSTVFGVDDYGAVNTSGNAHIAYCFTPIKGYSAMSTYVGNGNADGPFVYTGFKPAFIISRYIGANQNWQMYDNKRNPHNFVDTVLFPNGNADEEAYDKYDFLSNGFKARSTSTGTNVSGGTYIYLAFAENPFVTSTGIPTPAR